jgi:dihydrofolate reductase
MKAIVAVDKDWGIGKEGKLLFRIPEDMEFFKEMTTNRVVLMGRVTWDSLNHIPLPDRTNLVLTNKRTFVADGVNCYIGNEEYINDIIRNHYDMEDAFVIGGQTIYEKYLYSCSEIFVTRYEKRYDADTFFPNLEKEKIFEMKEVIKEGIFEGQKYQITRWVNTKLI